MHVRPSVSVTEYVFEPDPYCVYALACAINSHSLSEQQNKLFMNFQKNNIDFQLYIIYVSSNVFIACTIIDRR